MSTLLSLFNFKAWADAELIATLRTVDAGAHEAGWRTAIRTFNHIHVVDRIFQAHLLGQPHGLDGTNTPETPALDDLAAAVTAVDQWYIDQVASLSPTQLGEVLRFDFTDGDSGCMTREEILMHVLAHGGYHRGAVGQVLRGLGVAPPRELYTRFLHSTQPQCRAPA
jgi:uncharacterized damage-inducible protein DinB